MINRSLILLAIVATFASANKDESVQRIMNSLNTWSASEMDSCIWRLMNDINTGKFQLTSNDRKLIEGIDEALNFYSKGKEPTEKDVMQAIVRFLDNLDKDLGLKSIEKWWPDKREYRFEFQSLCRKSLMYSCKEMFNWLSSPKYCSAYVTLDLSDHGLVEEHSEKAVELAKKLKGAFIVGSYQVEGICEKTAKFYR